MNDYFTILLYMSFTKNKNSPGEYELEQFKHEKTREYHSYIGSRVNDLSCFPGTGLIGGRLSNTLLSKNSADIESELFGIGTCNLVNKKSSVIPMIKNLNTLSICEKIPLVLPHPLKVDKFQRFMPN